MATFEDNAVVTAEDLNNIAVDLGDTTFSAFSEEKFGVDKLNEITSDLVNKGILTTGNRCEAIVSGGKVYIQSGVIVFESGAKIRIEDPVAVDLVNGSYIYAVNNLLTGKANIEVGDSLPTSGDYVSIAQVDDAGEIVDFREMSVAKFILPAEFQNNYAEQTVYVNSRNVDNHNEVLECVFAPALPQCKFLLPKRGRTDGEYYWVELKEDYQEVYTTPGRSQPTTVYVKKVGQLLYFKSTHFISPEGNNFGELSFILA